MWVRSRFGELFPLNFHCPSFVRGKSRRCSFQLAQYMRYNRRATAERYLSNPP